MSTILDRFIGARQKTRQASNNTHWQQYRSLLEKFVSGAEVDANEAEEIIRQAGKTEENLQKDVATLEQRTVWSRQLAARNQAVATLTSADEELIRLQSEWEKARAKLQPKIDAAIATRRQAEQLQMTLHDIEGKLTSREHILDRSILEREAVLIPRRLELCDERRELVEFVRGLGIESRQQRLSYYRNELSKASQFDYATHSKCKKNISELETAVQNCLASATAHQRRIDEIDTELADIERKLQALHQEKLKP